MKPIFNKYFYFLLAILFFSPIWANQVQQNKSDDSINSALGTNQLAVEELNKLYQELKTDTSKQVLEKAKMAFEQANEYEIDTLILNLGQFIADYYYFEYDSLGASLKYLYEILPLAKKTGSQWAG